MFRVGLLLIIRAHYSFYTAVDASHAFMLIGCRQQSVNITAWDINSTFTHTHTNTHTHTHTHTHTQGIHKRMVWFQKLTRNLFLTLHGPNAHHQQQQMSRFLMRHQQFASHAYCGAAGPDSKMASQQEKAFYVLRFEVSRSVITVQRELRARFRKDAPYRNNITRCTLCPM